MPVYLMPVDYPESPIPLDKPVLLIGRQAECDVILTCSRKVSRRHCCIVQISDWYVLRDLGSTNGIGINGESIANEARFELGDEINVGDVAFELVEGKYDVPKGKVCIGPKLSKQPGPDAGEKRGKRRSKAESFRGIPSSLSPNGRKSGNDKRRLADVSRDAESNDETDYQEPEPVDEVVEGPPDDFGSETFGSDAGDHLDDKIEETFGSDMPGSGNGAGPVPLWDDDDSESPFAFMNDEDSDESESDRGSDAKSRKPRRPQHRHRQADDLDDETEAYDDDSESPVDFIFDDDEDSEPVRPTKKRRKQRPRDASLDENERLQDDVEVKKSGGGNGNAADSIIELDEFDLLD